MSILNLISLLSGLALFLYGISLMGDGLNLVAGNKLEVVLYRLTSNRAKGILLGTLVTAVIQSSSAASVMVVGFVNSGLMQFGQAVSVILGSILGTSITGWIITLSSVGGGSGWVELLSTTAITGVIAVVGIILKKFSKKALHHHVGDILMGFAVLMFGMAAMSAAVEPLRDSPTFLRLMVTLSNPILGCLLVREKSSPRSPSATPSSSSWRTASSVTPPWPWSRATGSLTTWPIMCAGTCWTPSSCCRTTARRASPRSRKPRPWWTPTRTPWAPICCGSPPRS